MAGNEISVGPHGSGTRNDNSSFLLNHTRSRKLKISGSWYQRLVLHHWTWYSNAGGIAKDIDHILVNYCGRIIQNFRVFQNAEFFVTDWRLTFKATFKLHVKSRNDTV